jgi:hypothetical protein
MTKLFPIKFAETEDPRIVARVAYLIEEEKIVHEGTEDIVFHKNRVKRLSNFIRKTMGETGMLSLSLSICQTKVLVCIYDKEATEDNFVHTYFDEERKLPYILTEEEYVEKIYSQTL